MTPPLEATFHGRPDTNTLGRIVAHRGASQIAPENTLSAFRMAAELGARWLEFDVSLLGDYTPVVHHDQTLDRCTNGTGPLDQLSADGLATIDAGQWFGPHYGGEPLATLDQAFDLIGALDLSANLEMKSHHAPPQPIASTVAAALRSRPWARTRILVSSYDLGALGALRRLMPDQPLAVLFDEPPANWPDVLAGLHACSLHVWHKFLTADILAQAQASGFHVRVFTVDEPSLVERFRGAGLTGVITNHPPLYLENPSWAAWAET